MQQRDYSDVARGFLQLAGIAPARPTAAYLAKLAIAFGRLPYENLTKILRAAEHDDPEARLRLPEILLAEHLELGAGGTCFSLTYFFEQILRFAGYETWPVFCDRSYGAATHCALMVPVEGKRFLVDPGYLLEAPLEVPVHGASEQRSASGSVQLVRLGESHQLLLVTERGGTSKIRYRLRDVPVDPLRFRQRWIDSFDWAMMRHLCVSRQTPAGQLYVRDGRLRLVKEAATTQDCMDARFADEVEKLFGIDRRLASLAHDAVQRQRSNVRDQQLRNAHFGKVHSPRK